MAVFTSAKNNNRWAMLFPEQKTGDFLDAHVAFFAHVGGVYRTLVYDNMRVAVRKFIGPHEKEPTEALRKLSLYYGFGFRFCNIRAGNEKGHVERSVEFVRRKAFAFQDEFATIEGANEYLLSVITEWNRKTFIVGKKQTILESFREEQTHLLPLAPPYETARTAYCRVGKYSTIVVDTCQYSVPDHLVGKAACLSKRIPSGFSSMTRNSWWPLMTNSRDTTSGKIRLEHYCSTLRKKPGALASSTAFQQADPWLQEIYQQYFRGKERHFVELVQYCKGSGDGSGKSADCTGGKTVTDG